MKDTLIQDAPLFSSLQPDEQKLIGKAMKELTFGKGETLYAQGQPNQRMYLIQNGWVKQTTTLSGGRPIVNNLGPGSLVGDMDLLLEQPAAGTAITNSEVNAWVLSHSDLNDLLDEHPHIGLKISAALGSRISHIDRYLVQTRLRGIPLFSDLGDEQLAAIAEKLEPLEIRRGGLIFRAGAPGDALFIVEEGEVTLSSTHEETGEPFRQLMAGDALGEMAVLTGKPYDGLARAATETLLWVFHRSDFLSVTTKYPQIRVAMSGRLSQPLSSDDRVLAQRQLARIRLFADLPYDAARSVASVLVLRHYPAGEVVFKAGDPGDSLIVIDDGGLRLTADGAQPWTLRSGDSYGESSLLTGKTRTATAIAETDSNLWLMYKSDFDSLLARFPAVGSALSKAIGNYLQSSDNLFLDQHLRGITLFAGLDDAAMRDIANALVSQKVQRGEVIFTEGQRGDAVYFIESGEVQLAMRVDSTPKLSFERMGAGDFFGELALLADNPRKATARASASDTQLWVLHKHEFDRIAIEHPQIALSLSKVLGERLARTDTRPVAPRNLQVRPPSGGGTAGGAGAARPLAAKPSSVPSIKRPQAAAPRPAPGVLAVPLAVKPPVAARPRKTVLQERPIAKRPAQPPVAPKPRPGGVPQPRAVAPRPAARAIVAVRPVSFDPATLAVVDSVKWVMARSVGFKFRMVALSMMFVWLCGITAPVAALSAMSLRSDSSQISFAGVAVNVNPIGGGPIAISAARVPTFTPTPEPTGKPAKAVTAVANSTQVAIAVAPTNSPIKPTARPRPTVKPTAADPVAASAPAPAAAVPAVDFKVAKIHHLTPCENGGNHHMFVLVLDAQGKGISDMDVEFQWDGGSFVDRTGKKVEYIPALGIDNQTSAGYVNWPVYKGRAKIRVVSATSEQTDWLSVVLPDERCDKNDNPQANSLFHHSYLVVFQRTH